MKAKVNAAPPSIWSEATPRDGGSIGITSDASLMSSSDPAAGSASRPFIKGPSRNNSL